MNNLDWKKVKGTVMICPPDDMPYSSVMKIVGAVTEVTRVEGGYESSFTLNGDILFFHISEDEADQIKKVLDSIFGEKYVSDTLCWCHDTDFNDDDEEAE